MPDRDEFDETAEKITPCILWCLKYQDEMGPPTKHAENCPAHIRPAIATALREAEQRGYANGAEAQIGATEQVQAILVERDRQIGTLHEILSAARSLIDPEANPEWEARAEAVLQPCDLAADIRREALLKAEARVAELEEAEADRRAGVYVPQVTLAELMREREAREKAEARVAELEADPPHPLSLKAAWQQHRALIARAEELDAERDSLKAALASVVALSEAKTEASKALRAAARVALDDMREADKMQSDGAMRLDALLNSEVKDGD